VYENVTQLANCSFDQLENWTLTGTYNAIVDKTGVSMFNFLFCLPKDVVVTNGLFLNHSFKRSNFALERAGYHDNYRRMFSNTIGITGSNSSAHISWFVNFSRKEYSAATINRIYELEVEVDYEINHANVLKNYYATWSETTIGNTGPGRPVIQSEELTLIASSIPEPPETKINGYSLNLQLISVIFISNVILNYSRKKVRNIERKKKKICKR
jgi:hypothetical protein